jgi:hypothetical protein
VNVVDDEWLGTFGRLAFLQIGVGDRSQETLTPTYSIFGNQRSAFPNLHVRDGQLAFSVGELTLELEDALRTAIADSEEQAPHLRPSEHDRPRRPRRSRLASNAASARWPMTRTPAWRIHRKAITAIVVIRPIAASPKDSPSRDVLRDECDR